ncbi:MULTISPECIES: RHS repeat-associated core domain-containing protein [Pseudescherichia]|uniref:RHS repeat-associated core domain-containing protein n=1 Tax=Pseudescherichia TaxID=2055880 RepID=UPI001EDEDDE8|nr:MULTISPECIES: RHS repeat-associated core domain-containing protein [Pseudescherichia]
MTLQITGNNMNGSPELSLSRGNCNAFAWSPFGGGGPSKETVTSLPGFNGERQDPLSGATHLGNGYRAYSPALRRFTCPDSESPFGEGGVNPYVYCDHDPVNNTDPSGHVPGRNAAAREAQIGAQREALMARRRQAEALHVAQQPPIQRPNGATGLAPELVQRRAAPAAPVQGVRQQRPRRGAINEHPASTSGQVTPSSLGVERPAPLNMLKEKAIEDAYKIRAGIFVNYQDRRDDFRINIHGGRLYYQGKLLTTEKNGSFKFILTDKNHFYGVETSHNYNGIKHSSILGTTWPLAAGTMDVENGRLLTMTNASGHFYPNLQNMKYAKAVLNQYSVHGVKIELYETPLQLKRLKESVTQYKTKYVNFTH